MPADTWKPVLWMRESQYHFMLSEETGYYIKRQNDYSLDYNFNQSDNVLK